MSGGDIWLTPAFALLAITCVSLVLIAVFAGTPYRASLLWASLSITGFAVALQLIDAGRAVRYQHYRPAVASLTTEDWTLVACLAAYSAVIVLGALPHASAIRAWVVSNLSRSRLIVILAAWALLSASPLRDLRGFGLEIVISTTLGLIALGAVVLSAISLPDRLTAAVEARVRAWNAKHEDRRLDPVAIASAVFATVSASVLAVVVWESHPHISDEISFLYQATYFAGGSLSAPGVPVPELFAAYQIDCSTERCISVLQPGWPALLSLGVRLGVPWLINPVLAGVNALLFFALTRELYGKALARVAVLLMVTSPWYLFLGMSMMNHQATLLGGLLGVLGTTMALRRRGIAWIVLAGFGAGLTGLMRPMDGIIVAALVGLPLLFAGTLARRALAVATCSVTAALVGSLNLLYNRAVTGSPLEFPVTTYVNELWGPGTNNLGFGPDRGVYPLWAHMDGFPGHSPFQAVVNALLNVTALQVELFGWAFGSLLLIGVLLALGRLRRVDWMMIGWFVLINLLYSLYWFASGPDFAARYWFLAIVPLVLLTARGLQTLSERLETAFPSRGRAALTVSILVLMAQSVLVFVPWRSTDKYYRYYGTGPLVRQALERERLAPGVYLIRGSNQPDYAAAMIYAAPDLAGGDVVFAYDSLPDAGERLMAAYPDRRIWWLDGPSTSDGDYWVRALISPPVSAPDRGQ